MNSDLRNPLKNAKGLGAAKEGTGHFIAQRLTAIALAPLSIWFLVAVFGLVGGGYPEARSFLAQPLNAILMAAFVLALFQHAKLGMDVVIEDYIHQPAAELGLKIAIKFVVALAVIASLLSIVRITLGA
jgi:succinate dehydrogenase / fumarate reductase membrane anchor subunit